MAKFQGFSMVSFLLFLLPVNFVVFAAPGIPVAAGPGLDQDGNGVEDILDSWQAGRTDWFDLQQRSRHSRLPASGQICQDAAGFPGSIRPAPGSWSAGRVRLIALGNSRKVLDRAGQAAALAGEFAVIHDLEEFGGIRVISVDQAALLAFLDRDFDGRLFLDRDGLPALVHSRLQVGADQVAAGTWRLGEDWSATVAILDSGCDTAHGDLGDYAQDDVDGPPPAVGDAADWYSAAGGWPLFQGYRVVGWHDVSDDFPAAQGPWDYYYHGTALASVVAGSGDVDPDYRGLNPGGRLTVVKFYDFDGVWHTWAGDFLAACAWTLENRDTYRVRTVLAAVNWEVDLGLSEAMDAFLDAGIVPVAAMGNFGDDPAGPGFPASLPGVLTVGSIDPDGAVSAFSGRGLVGQNKPDLLAPGGGVTAADNEPDDSYSMRQGTSLAAAHVAGALYLLEEALVDNGIHLPADRTSALTRMALLRASCARVDQAAEPGGQGSVILPGHDVPDRIRGWGLVRVDAAVRAVLLSLFPGDEQTDTLSLDFQRPVTARRLALEPGVRYLVEAVPQAGLDVDLAVVGSRDLDSDPFGTGIPRENAQGPGVSEFTFYHAGPDDWAFLVVRRVAGSGRVTLRVTEADGFTEQSLAVQLPGKMVSAPNVGHLAGCSGPTIVVPSRVEVDYVARAANVMDSHGISLPGWPVFVFPHSSAQGGLSQPLVWNLDGIDGDEIVFSSEFGSVYFFNRLGAWNREELDFNVPLTTPVGVQEVNGDRRVLVLDRNGTLFSWSWGPVLEFSTDLGYSGPLDPAVGQLAAGPEEELAIAFAGGRVLVVDSSGNTLPGWPVDLGTELETRPVLCDLDEDGLHEIILPDLDQATGILRFFVLTGSGEAGPGNGSVVPAPSGGNWLMISSPVVAGRYGTGDLRVSVSGLVDNGLAGSSARWSLGLGCLQVPGIPVSETLPGLEVRATTSQGVLNLQNALLPTPLAWDFLGGTGTEVATIIGLDWTELLYGLTAIHGSEAAWILPTRMQRPLEGRIPLRPGGSSGSGLTAAGGLLIQLDSEVFLQVRVLDDILGLLPVPKGHGLAPCWSSARADQRNSAAYPLRTVLTPVPGNPVVSGRLAVYPNPGSGRFRFLLEPGEGRMPGEIRVFDLRGRLVRALASAAGEGLPVWDGLDGNGRRVAAGTYLAQANLKGMRFTTRFVVTR